MFYIYSFELLVDLVLFLIWLRRGKKWVGPTEASDKLLQAYTAPYNIDDPKFDHIRRVNAQFALVLGIVFFLVDLLAGFPNGDGAYSGRAFYVLLIVLGVFSIFNRRKTK